MNKSRSQQNDETTLVGATNRQRLANQPKSASLGSSGAHRKRPSGPVSAVSFEGRRYRDVSPTRENNNGLVAFNKVSMAESEKPRFFTSSSLSLPSCRNQYVWSF